MIAENKIKPDCKILLAEGDRFLSKVISNKLLRRGFCLSLANDGLEAMAKIKTEQFDLVLLDLTLSKKNGLEVLAELKKDKKLKIKIVVLLSLSKTSDIEKIKKLGITDYIIKSDLSINTLADKVGELIK
ncbi:MAG: response regulator [Candidatus Buchananbacteria bacterium]|nr:response regulator [Candidatus Buchananbacteria bacterium]